MLLWTSLDEHLYIKDGVFLDLRILLSVNGNVTVYNFDSPKGGGGAVIWNA